MILFLDLRKSSVTGTLGSAPAEAIPLAGLVGVEPRPVALSVFDDDAAAGMLLLFILLADALGVSDFTGLGDCMQNTLVHKPSINLLHLQSPRTYGT